MAWNQFVKNNFNVNKIKIKVIFRVQIILVNTYQQEVYWSKKSYPWSSMSPGSYYE